MLRLKNNLSLVIILALFLLLPFIAKAFHIDDTVFLYCAREILKVPLLCYSDATINWLGFPQTLRFLTSSPLLSYYIAPVIKVVGESELGLHIFFIIFPVIAMISMYFLSKHFTNYPLISVLFLISTPAFMVSATNIMPDIALFAFYLAGISTFIYGLDSENKLLLIISGLIIGLACLIKYTGFTIIPLLFSYAILQRKFFKGIFVLSFAIILLGIWCLHNTIFLKGLHFIEALFWVKPTFTSIFSNLFGTLIFIGSTTIFPFLLILLIRTKKGLFIYFFIIWLTLLVLFNFTVDYTFPQMVLGAFFISIAIFLCLNSLNLLKDNLANRTDIIFLLFWLLIIFCWNVFILSWFTAARYTLILTPALILLFLKLVSPIINKSYVRNFIYIGIFLNLLLSLLLNFADYIYADTYRNFTKNYAKYLRDKETRVWFRGHWGFQYYMEKEGFTYLGLDDMPREKDIIITTSVCSHEPFSLQLREKLEFRGTIKYESLFPLRTVFPKDRMNFYSYAIGWLPYGISNEPLEVFQIWEAE